ncbi:MAG TPA: quinol:electron acceptor oxidoreductase subunit ActD [Terriglobia bacterium]|nr:quinol:electron acceptor oxidoreductase subunit ActD [Terriglobia bacterium]
MKAIYGLFPGPGSAQRAFDVLERAENELGFTEGDIVVLSGEPYEEYGFGQRDNVTRMPWIAALGGLVGGLSGWVFVVFTQKDYPMISGGMQLVTKWPNGIIAYELTMLGVILATLFTLLIAARIPAWRGHKLYDPAVSNGKILIGVLNPPETAREELGIMLRAAGAESLKDLGN